MNSKVDFYFNGTTKWQEEIKKLRTIVLDCGLTEGLKWGVPCYMLQKSNIVIIHAFKEYCALLFFKGSLLQDSDGILIQQTPNVQSARQIRFTNIRAIAEMEPILKSFISQAIAVEKAGLKLNFKKDTELIIPQAFQAKLNENPPLKIAFDALTPGRKRAYLLYFFAPKQPKTQVLRVEKSIQNILNGKGLHE